MAKWEDPAAPMGSESVGAERPVCWRMWAVAGEESVRPGSLRAGVQLRKLDRALSGAGVG